MVNKNIDCIWWHTIFECRELNAVTCNEIRYESKSVLGEKNGCLSETGLCVIGHCMQQQQLLLNICWSSARSVNLLHFFFSRTQKYARCTCYFNEMHMILSMVNIKVLKKAQSASNVCYDFPKYRSMTNRNAFYVLASNFFQVLNEMSGSEWSHFVIWWYFRIWADFRSIIRRQCRRPLKKFN